MNLTKLFEMQRELDARIVKEKGLEGQDLLPQKILALQVELGECANEWRGFKFWSNRQEPKMFPLEQCSYCGEYVSFTRPSPFMADFGADMCEECWDATQKEYAASNDEYIPDFKDYPHFPEKIPQKLLEEYIDCLHFILSIGLEAFHDTSYMFEHVARSAPDQSEFTLAQFNRIYGAIVNFERYDTRETYMELFDLFFGLGRMLGFTWEQIEAAYMAKNAVNHDRQSTGY